MTPLLIVSSMFPPREGGLPDHTDRLADALSQYFRVTVLTSQGLATDRPFSVRAEVADWQDSGALEAAVGRVAPVGPILWQYVPHMYGRGGVNFAVPRAMRRLRARGRRQVVLAHEIAAPWSWWPQRNWYAWSHRRMWRGVRAAADRIGVSTAAWIERGVIGAPDSARFFLAPSPANLSVVPVGREHRRTWRQAHGLEGARSVLGFFGSPGAGKQFDWVLEAWRERRRTEPATALVVVGGRPVPPPAGEEARWCPSLGYLEAGAASEALQAMDVLALPFVDGVSERRSSFMAGLAHGLPVVTCVGPATGDALRRSGLFVGVEGGPSTFAQATSLLLGDGERRAALAEWAAKGYAGEYAWPILARRLKDRLNDGSENDGLCPPTVEVVP